MGRYLLGEFEHLVLLTVIRLEGEGYGVSITRAIEAQTGKSVAQAATYLTLRRLEEKGWISGRDGDASERRGGRPKRCYAITPEGMERVTESRETLRAMWSAIGGEFAS